MAWLSGYGYRKKLTIDNTNVDSALSDFPLYVEFSSDSDIGGNLEDTVNAYDIRFTQSDGQTELDFDPMSRSVSGGNFTGYFFVEVPTISSGSTTDIYIYYGKAGDSDGANVNGTWDSNYKGVWH